MLKTMLSNVDCVPIRLFVNKIAHELAISTDLCGDRWVSLSKRKAETIAASLELITKPIEDWTIAQKNLHEKIEEWATSDYSSITAPDSKELCPYCLFRVEHLSLHDCTVFPLDESSV